MMRWLIAGLFCALFSPAGAQQPDKVTLTLTVEQVKLIADILPTLGCQTVQQLLACNRAIELIREIQRQAQEQVK